MYKTDRTSSDFFAGGGRWEGVEKRESISSVNNSEGFYIM